VRSVHQGPRTTLAKRGHGTGSRRPDSPPARALLRPDPAVVTASAVTATLSLGGSGLCTGYGSIRNAGPELDRLLEVKLDGSRRMELHGTVREGTMAKMRRIRPPLHLARAAQSRFEPINRQMAVSARPDRFSFGNAGGKAFACEHAEVITTRLIIGYRASS
jgi:hypothetical protein